ncbi:protein ASPARTIC PROTEASE IN GUARD CELL 1-like, partial [Arachis ipaensis]
MAMAKLAIYSNNNTIFLREIMPLLLPYTYSSHHALSFQVPMAPLFSVIVLFIIIICDSPLAHSRTTPHHIPKTTFLDVTASIQKTLQVLDFNHHKQQEQLSSTPSSKLSLHLHSRVSLQKPTHHDYKSLTLSRLERDSARVTTLLTRSQSFSVSELEGPIVSGTSQGSGEYFSRVGIGEPPNPVYMVLDTGSDISWVQCSPCSGCYRQSDPIFDPNSSSSFHPLSCDSTHCQLLDESQCLNSNCLYEVSYGDGSYTVGEFVTETITIGQSSVTNIAIGCGHNNQGLFIGAAGLLGLGGGTLSFPAQLNSTSFS